jgi:RNA recognition motif-containing protein
MKSPNISTVVIAAICAVIAFFVFSSIAATPMTIAAFVFISAFVAPLISFSVDTSSSSSEDESNHSDSDVKTLYVGNLPYRANEVAVRELFSTYGKVESVRLMKDKHTGKRRGFGFVEMSADDLEKAITALNDAEFQQRTLKVREAKERPERDESAS